MRAYPFSWTACSWSSSRHYDPVNQPIEPWSSTSGSRAWSSTDGSYYALRPPEHRQREAFDLGLQRGWPVEKKAVPLDTWYCVRVLTWIGIVLTKISSMQVKYIHRTKFYTTSVPRPVGPAVLLSDEGLRGWYGHSIAKHFSSIKYREILREKLKIMIEKPICVLGMTHYKSSIQFSISQIDILHIQNLRIWKKERIKSENEKL